MFQKGQRIAVAVSDYFEPVGEVVEVQGDDEASLVKVKWGKKTGGKEEWIQAKDLLTKLESKRFKHWKLFGGGWGEPKPVEVSLSKTSAPEMEAIAITNPLQTLREARAILKKDFDSWFQSEWERKEHRFSTFFFSFYNLARGRDFLDASAYVDESEMRSRLAEIKELDQKIAHVEKTGQLPRPGQPQEPLAAYGQMQAFYLAFHPEVTRSALWQRINEMIGRGILTTALPLVATASDLEAILKDIDTYNLEVAEGSKRHLGYGYLDIRRVKDEIARLLHIEANYPDAIQLMKQTQTRVYPAVKDLQKNPNLRTVGLMGDAGKTIIIGAAELVDDPSLALMLVAGAGAAGPLSRKLVARLIAAGVPLKRARLMGLAYNGMLFHTSKSAMEFGLDQLPGVDRSRYIDFSAAGNLHAIAMMGFLGQTQKLYGASVQGYLRFLKDQPALQKTLDTIGSKTFETIGLTSFNLGLSTAHNGFEALSPDNIYRELIDSARFTIAYGAMHAGQHIKKGPAQEGFELAQKNLWAEVRRQEAKGKLDRAKIRTLTTNAQKAFEAFQSEQNEGLKRNERLGRRSVPLRRVSGGSGLPDVSSIYGRAIFHVIGPENSLRRDLKMLCHGMKEVGSEEFKQILRGLMTIVKIRLEQRIPSALEQAHQLDELIHKVHDQEALHDVLNELYDEAEFLEADEAIETAARKFRDIPAPLGPRGEVRVNGERRAGDVVKGEIGMDKRGPLPDEQIRFLKKLVRDARFNPQIIEDAGKREGVARLETAIQTGDPVKILQALAQLPNIMVDQSLGSNGRYDAVHVKFHRDISAFQGLLADLFILAHQQIQGGEAPMTELELAAALNQAGWLGPEAKQMSRKQPLRQRLQAFGFSHEGDWLNTLKKVLAEPKRQLKELWPDHQIVTIDPEYDQLVKDLVSHIERTEPDRGGAELDGLLKQHGRDGFGRRKLFPKTEAFFQRHYGGRYFNPNNPLEMLDRLVYPDASWLHGDTAGFDPVGKVGYARAVRELAEAVIPSYYLEEPKIGRMGVYWFPFGKIELTPPTPITRRELLRFLQGSSQEIEARIHRWQDNGNGEAAEPRANETIGVVYHRGVRGGRTSGLQGRERTDSEHGWDWAKMDQLGEEPVGRFYIGVRARYAKIFWETLKAEVFTVVQSDDLKFQAKISNDPGRLEASGDATVIYFQAKDQQFFYDRVVQFVCRHQDKGWFHTLEMDRRPILAAQVLDPEGEPVAGLSFGQDPKGYTSFNELRAQAITRALRGERLLNVLGVLKNLGPEAQQNLRMGLILWELQRMGVDPENPAFQKDGVQQFPFLHLHTDQGFAKQGQTPVSGTRQPIPISGGSGLPDVSSIYGQAIVHVIEPKNSLRRDLETLCKNMVTIGPEEFKEIVAKLMLLVKARIESGDRSAAEQAHTLDLLIRRAHGQEVLHPLLAELFQQSILLEADRIIEKAVRELRNLDVRGEVRRGGSVVADADVVKGELVTPAKALSKAQVGVLEALVAKGRKWRKDTTRLDAAISSDDPIKVLRALAELQPIPEYVDGAKGPDDAFLGVSHREDPSYLEVVGGLVALARQQIRSGRLGLTEAELEIIAKQAGWEKEAQPLPRLPSPRATLPISSRGAGSADPHFAQRVVDSVRSQFLRDTLQGQLLAEDMETDGRGGQRIANGRLGELLYGAFGTLIMPAMYGGEEGTQGAVVSALVELVEIIESVRRQGIEVDLDPEYWRKALNIVGR